MRCRYARGLSSLCLFVGLAVAQFGCSETPREIASPQVRLIGLSLVEGSAESQRFRVSLLITNPNPFPLPIEQYRFSLRLAGEGRLNGNSTLAVTLPAQDDETIRLDVDSDMVSSLSRLLALVQGPENTLPYEIDGELIVDRQFYNSLPFHTSGQVPLSTSLTP